MRFKHSSHLSRYSICLPTASSQRVASWYPKNWTVPPPAPSAPMPPPFPCRPRPPCPPPKPGGPLIPGGPSSPTPPRAPSAPIYPGAPGYSSNHNQSGFLTLPSWKHWAQSLRKNWNTMEAELASCALPSLDSLLSNVTCVRVCVCVCHGEERNVAISRDSRVCISPPYIAPPFSLLYTSIFTYTSLPYLHTYRSITSVSTVALCAGPSLDASRTYDTYRGWLTCHALSWVQLCSSSILLRGV